VRRLEVFTGAGRRRSWTYEQKAQIVVESHAEGATVCEVARYGCGIINPVDAALSLGLTV
jgi:transposase-like protein